MPKRPFLLFYSYSSKDERFREELDDHLATLQREGVLSTWSFRRILAGDEWDRRINEKLNQADIILLLVSAHFLASEYCVGVEVKRALQRHDRGEALVVPVILADCDWRTYDFAKLQALPTLARPVTNFHRRDAAWADVVHGVRQAAAALAEKDRADPLTQTRNVSPAQMPATSEPVPTSRRLNELNSRQRTDADRAEAKSERVVPPSPELPLRAVPLEQQPFPSRAVADLARQQVTGTVPPATLAEGHVERNRQKLLAIEDDPEVVALYKSYLQKRGYEVLTATGAVEGMNLFNSNPDVGLIILDLNLPGMSGEEWFAWFRRDNTTTPVVIASGKGDILTIAKASANTSAITKPFHMEELQELLEVLLEDDWISKVSVDRKLH